MASSITVDNELRIKIKKLAAEMDTTQGEVIRQAIDLFELPDKSNRSENMSEARITLQKSLLGRRRPKWKQKIRDKLEEAGIDLDDLRMEFYDFEED